MRVPVESSILTQLVYGLVLNFCVLRATANLLDAVHLPSRFGSFESFLVRGAAAVVIAAALIVAIVTVGGLAGLLDRPEAILMLAAASALAIEIARAKAHWRRPPSSDGKGRPDLMPWLAVGFLLTAWLPLLAERLTLPPVSWDALTYHLRFPVLWLQTGSLMTAPPPLGDSSHVYFPLAGEMLLYWQLLSTGTDLWSSLSQVPFALAGAGALAALALRCGAAARHATLAGLCWLSTPGLLRQSVEPMVDVVLAACFLCALLFSVSFREDGGRAWLLLAAASLGLLVGTKYAGILYAVAAIPVLEWAFRTDGAARKRTGILAVIVAGALLLLLGGFSYVRNAVSGGNPLLPIRLQIGATPLLPGPVSSAYYFGSESARLGWRELLFSGRALLEMGPFFLPLLGVLVLGLFHRGGAIQPTVRRLAAAGTFAFLLAAALLPFREHRYFLPVAAIAWALCAALASARWPVAAERVGILAIAVHAPLTLFYWGKDLAAAGATAGHWVGIGLVAGTWIVFLVRSNSGTAKPVQAPVRRRLRGSRGVRGALAAAALAFLGILAVLSSKYDQVRYDLWLRYWSTRHEWENLATARADYAQMATSWTVLARETRGRSAVVAFAGTNIPYPLLGYDRRNRVLYVPRNANQDAAYYDWGREPPDPMTNPSKPAWLQNLTRYDVEYLCVYRLPPAVDPLTRFPAEAEWSDSDPARFTRIWDSPWARIYRVAPGQRADPSDTPQVRDHKDPGNE